MKKKEMEHYKSRNNDYYHFTNPHDNISQLSDYYEYDYHYDHPSQSQSFDDDEDNCSCDFNFHTYQSSPTDANSQISGVKNRKDAVSTFAEELGTFDKGAFIFQLENTMKNISDRLQHRIEGIGTRISRLDDETCKLDKCVEDVKSSEERYHGTTHRKLTQMQSVLQEVQDGVLFLRDKNEIASAQLQLARIQASKRDKTTAAQKNPQQPLPAPQSSSHVLATPQPVSYHPAVSQASDITLRQYIIPPIQQSQTPHQYKRDAQFPHFTQPHQWNTSQGVVNPQNLPFSSHPPQKAPNVPSYSYSSNVQYIPSEPATWGSSQDHEFGFSQPTHVQPSRNYKSEFHAKYMPEVASFPDIHSHGKLPSSYETINVEEPTRSKYTHIPVSQDLPYALPTAIVLEDGSGSEGNEKTVSVDDIVDDVTAMGFRRDLVRACVRKLTTNGSPVDLNAVLDSMMKNK